MYEEQPIEIQREKQLTFLLEQENNGINSPEVHFHIAQIYFSQNNFDKALNYLNKSLSKEPDNIEFLHLGIKINNELKKYERSIELGQKTGVNEDLPSDYLIDLAWAYSMDGNYKTSQRCLGLATIKTPIVNFLNGYNFLLSGDTINGLNKLNNLKEQSIIIPELYTTLSDIYYAKGRYGKLRETIQKASNIGLSDTLLWEHAANYELVLDNHTGANLIYKKILKLDPSHYRANKLLAKYYFDLGIETSNYKIRQNLDTCLIYMNKIVDVASKDDFMMMGQAYKKLRRYDESLEYYQWLWKLRQQIV